MFRLFISGLGANIFVMVINFITGVISARALGPVGRGILAEANRWPSLLSLLFTFGLHGAVIYLGKKYPERQSSYLGAYLIMSTICGVAGLSAGYAIVRFGFNHQPSGVIKVVEIGMFTIPFAVISDALVGTLQSKNQFRKLIALRVLVPTGNLGIIISLLCLKQYDPLHYMLLMLGWGSVTFSLTFVWVTQLVRPRLFQLGMVTKELIRRGIQIYAGSLTSTFGGNLDQLLISIFLQPHVLGYYSIASNISSIIPSMLIGAFGLFLWPKLMDMMESERVVRVEQMHSSVFVGLICFSGVIVVLIPGILPLIYGDKFNSSVVMTQILLLGTPFTVGYVILLNLLSTFGRFRVATYAELTGIAVVLVVFSLANRYVSADAASLGVTVASVAKWAIAITALRTNGLSIGGAVSFNPKAVMNAISQRNRF